MIEIRKTFSPDGMLRLDYLTGVAFSRESGAHRFVISGPEAFTGTVTASFMRADGQCVIVTGSLDEDGRAVVTADEDCYLVPGRMLITVYVTDGGVKTCVYAGLATVYDDRGSGEAPSGETTRTIEEMLEEILEGVDNAQQLLDDAGELLDDVTAEGATQVAAVQARGDQVIASIPSDYSALTGEVSSLKSAVNNLWTVDDLSGIADPQTDWALGYYNTNTHQFMTNVTDRVSSYPSFAVTAKDSVVIKRSDTNRRYVIKAWTVSGGTYTNIINTDWFTNDFYVYTPGVDCEVAILSQAISGSITVETVGLNVYVINDVMSRIADLKTADANLANELAKTNEAVKQNKVDWYTVGEEPVEIQKISNAANFVLNDPSGGIVVSETDKPIFTGTPNIIDLLNIKQGTFTDTTSGAVIEISGNEVYIHGTTTAGFKFDLQHGVFFTDSQSNHPADLDIFPAYTNGYRLCFYEETGYTMPSNVYFGRLDQAGTTIAGAMLSSHSGPFYKNGTYLTLYANSGITGLNVKFRLGLKIESVPGGIAPIDDIPFMEYDTTVITNPGYYALGTMTWTGDDTVYSAKPGYSKLVRATDGHVYAWFGDSISQLKDLPILASMILGCQVYDCTFAGAPLTYGDPTKYQPTGFVSLVSQMIAGDFDPLSDALDAQEAAGINVTEKRKHMATLEAMDLSEVTDIVILAGANDFDNDYVNATNFVSGFSGAVHDLLTEYPHLMIYVISPPWRGDKSEGKQTLPTMQDIVDKEKEVAESYNMPFYDLYNKSGINSITAGVYLESDLLHPSAAGDNLLAERCAKFIQSN